MTDTPGKWPSEAKPVPRWVTSWPDWYGVKGNVAVVPASDYDNLGRYVHSLPAQLVADLKWVLDNCLSDALLTYRPHADAVRRVREGFGLTDIQQHEEKRLTGRSET